MSGNKSAQADVQVFEKASKFGTFLKETVGDMPSPAAAATGNAPNSAIFLFLFFSVFITSVLQVS